MYMRRMIDGGDPWIWIEAIARLNSEIDKMALFNAVGKPVPGANQLDDEPQNQQAISRLAALTPIEYDQCRVAEAKALNVRPGTLDKEVAKTRASIQEANTVDVVENLEPWPEAVNGDLLASEMAQTISRHVLLKPGQATALALWALGSCCMDGWRIYPKMMITSPEKRCGKSTLLETLEGMVYRPLLASNITPSAIFRCIEAWHPSLLIDEADTFAKDNDELNGIVNSGHSKRTASVIRTEKAGDGFEPRKFSTWCAQIIAGIGSQRGTLLDRSIRTELTRALPGQKPAKLPGDYFETMATTRRKCQRWARDNLGELRHATAEVPACGNDRMEDNWQPLFVLANLIGGDWPDKVLAAYIWFSESTTDGDEPAGHMLIEDISEILDSWPHRHIFSRVLVDRLIGLEDRPWCEWRRGKPLTQNSLSKLLKPYRLISNTCRIGHEMAKGYDVEKMKSAFAPYLSITPVQSVTTSQPAPGKGSDVTFRENVTVQSVTSAQSVTKKPNKDVVCDGVTVETPGIENTRQTGALEL